MEDGGNAGTKATLAGVCLVDSGADATVQAGKLN